MTLQPYQQRILAFWSRAKPGDKLMLTRNGLRWLNETTVPQPVSTEPLRGLRAEVVFIDEVDGLAGDEVRA